MNSRQFLDAYLHDLRRRLRRVVLLRAAATAAVLALIVTVIAVWALQRSGFPVPLAISVRVGFGLVLLALSVVLLWQPLRKLASGARELERHVPQQNGRIETYLELAGRQAQGREAPMIDLLADDAAEVAKTAPIDTVVPRRRLLVPAALAGAAAVALVLTISLGGSYWGFGSRYLWLGMEVPEDQLLLRQVVVSPGDTKVRRNQDLAIRAVIRGFDASEGELFVRAGAASKWERAAMRGDGNGSFELTLYALREPLRYYVRVAGVQSAEHRVEVVDLPQVERVRLTYRYPQWTGLPVRSDTAPEIRAVAGTRVELEIQTTAPLAAPTLVVNGSAVPLTGEGRVARGSVMVTQSGEYRVSTRFGDETVALTEDHPIVVIADEKPSIEITKPGRDWRATNIEEVPVQVRAGDDFNLQTLELRYAVNGGDWKRVALGANTREINAGTLLRLEEMGTTPAANLLSPGDIVSYYAVARDHQQTVQTDLFLIQVQPFERRITQSQAMSGQGGEEQENGISERQREILLATWNLQRAGEKPGTRAAERVADNARMLAEVQKTLAGQARTLINRTRARMMVAPGSDTEKFITNLELAEKAMQPAAERLSELELAKAVPAEQSALQYLLRAEAVYTDIQMAFQRDMNGGGGSQSSRDLAEMFELEMDLDKNQYETASKLAEAEESSPEKLDEMIRKLRELAERQEKLAREAAKERDQGSQQQRWKQEQLRRETEQLRQRLADLKKRAQEQASRQSGGGGGGQGDPESQEPSEEPSGNAESMAAAIQQLERALDNMEDASKREGAQMAENQKNGRQGEQPSERESSDGSAASGERQAANQDAQSAGEEPGRNNKESQKQRAEADRAAQAAGRNLRRAIDEMERNKRTALASDFKDLEERARGILDTQRRSEDALQAAASDSRELSRAGRGALEQRSGLAETKRDLQSQLQSLESDISAAAQRHKKEAPRASEQLSTAGKNLSESGIHSRLSRSASEIARGRLQEAASRQGLITESLEGLRQDLNEATRVAATEAAQTPAENNSAEDMLAELTAIRRAWEEAQSRPQDRVPEKGTGQAPNPADVNRDPSQLVGGRPGGLDVWLPPVGRGPPPRSDTPEFKEESLATAERLRNLQRRMPRGAFAPPDVRALEELTKRLRGSGVPTESEYDRILALTQQLELAALKAAQKQNASTTRATNPASDSPQYRNSVAEYYRRLGGEKKN
jgi:hypothetical protein